MGPLSLVHRSASAPRVVAHKTSKPNNLLAFNYSIFRQTVSHYVATFQLFRLASLSVSSRAINLKARNRSFPCSGLFPTQSVSWSILIYILIYTLTNARHDHDGQAWAELGFRRGLSSIVPLGAISPLYILGTRQRLGTDRNEKKKNETRLGPRWVF